MNRCQGTIRNGNPDAYVEIECVRDAGHPEPHRNVSQTWWGLDDVQVYVTHPKEH